MQQSDPLGPFLFSLVLQRLISSIDADDGCLQVLFQAWYLDDGVLTGRRSAVLRALSLIKELGPSLGIHINLAKYELFSHYGNSMFPPAVKFSHFPNLDILGAPIGDYLFCSKFFAGKCAVAKKLLSSLHGRCSSSGPTCGLVSLVFVWQLLQIGPPGKGHPIKSGRFFEAV